MNYLDFGGSGPLMQLAPANGMPPEAYRPLVAALAGRAHVVGYRPRPLHRPASEASRLHSWRELASDLLQASQTLGAGPLIGVGHSLGGVMTLYAALWQPERFSQVILIDPVIMPQRQLFPLWLIGQLGLRQRTPLAQGAARRRDRFASLDEARQRYRGRGIFNHFTPEALEGYLEGGLRPDGDGVRLAWPREWESRIFSLVPIDVWDGLRKLRLPLTIVRGTRSDLLIDRSWRQLQRLLPNAHLIEIAAGHMLPMEEPAAVAEVILAQMNREQIRRNADVSTT